MHSRTAQAYTTNQRSKTINVVYDDSSSMIIDANDTYLDRWGQAKYAMEVFAAMLEEKDTMSVYYMSDFMVSANTSVPPKLTISGSEPAETRVAKIHNTVTPSSGTPFDAVAKAYEDLKKANTDEKWLVVLTDGEFNYLDGKENYSIDVDDFFSQYVSTGDIKIMFLAMGRDATVIHADPGRNIYFEHATNSSEILGKITSICNRIFNRNQLSFTNSGRQEFTFDIPMMELLVFAQGANVRVNTLTGGDSNNSGTGRTYTLSESVYVQYSEIASTSYRNDPKVVISRDLTGMIAAFRNIPKGTYTLDIAGAQTVDIYYKPDVNVDIKLYQNGEEIDSQDIPEGDYQIRFGMIDDNGDFFESSLLGKIQYDAFYRNNDQTVPIQSGDTVSITPGDLTISVSSRFLDINTAEHIITRSVASASLPLEIDITAPNEDLTVTTLNDSGAFLVTIKQDGALLTWDQWQNMPLPTITTVDKVAITEVRHGTGVSTYEFFLKQQNNDKFATSTGDIILTATAEFTYDRQPYRGQGTITVTIIDDIGFWERFLNVLKKIWPLLALLMGVLLYWLLWGRKKRFPKYMSAKPTILVESDYNTVTKYGSFRIISKTKWLPLCPESGTLIAAADGKPLPSLKIKAVGNERMELTNTGDFAPERLGSTDFFINDQPLPEGSTKKKEMSCTARIKSVYYSGGISSTHTCSFSKKRKKKKKRR